MMHASMPAEKAESERGNRWVLGGFGGGGGREKLCKSVGGDGLQGLSRFLRDGMEMEGD